MKHITKIACKTAGIAGMGVVLYDAIRLGNRFSKAEAERTQSKYLEKAYFNSRNLSCDSYISNDIQKGVYKYKEKNPIPVIWGKFKGAIKGALNGFGNNIFLIATSALALISKGKLAIAGVAGIGLNFIYEILHNGFGVGKNNPMH